MKRIWKSPTLLSGIIANVAIAVSTVQFFCLPFGSGVDYENWFILLVLPISLLAFVIGIALWAKISWQEETRNPLLENVGLLLNGTPFFLALLLLDLAFETKGLWDNG